MPKLRLLSCLIIFLPLIALSQTNVIPLYDGKIPHWTPSDEKEESVKSDILRYSKVHTPTLDIFLPPKKNATGKAVVICPGGGYRHLAYDWEGTEVAKLLNAKGIAAFVLKYRIPTSKSVTNKEIVPLEDAQRAIRIVRKNAESWNIKSDQIGVMGFSAGGHLASTLGTHYDEKIPEVNDSLTSISARPDFMILIYPVITFKENYTHQGSRERLIGKNPSEEMVEHYSNELQVTANTPPTFLVHSTDDNAVPVENSLMFYRALKDKGVPVEMHIYPYGGHGFGLAIGRGHLQTWPDRLLNWIDYLNEE
ncbi:alpha/beta hydrolase [Galbibacter sp. EGI 63066]|uniref:alpha/beta hydrolase n=1 Tax=Galbibacter sp. EGI 63066 TaxID=2993559 RepID=UPI0022490F58|nr:alpha/beta hydrolase [Galbibacter sp. EGI 63066]MCX2678574.1 alpha/beta hydrolase [Galbibacter sp. EGI 63066]